MAADPSANPAGDARAMTYARDFRPVNRGLGKQDRQSRGAGVMNEGPVCQRLGLRASRVSEDHSS